MVMGPEEGKMKSRKMSAVIGCFVGVCLLFAFCVGVQAASDTKEPVKAKYGGELVYAWDRQPLYFDESVGLCYYATTFPLTNECLFQGDITKGPGGTKEAQWVYNMDPHPSLMAGGLAEKWELTDPETIVFHIRQGVRWHNKPPVNGRELTAKDVAFSLNRLWQAPKSYHSKSYNWEIHGESITATDNKTVVIKCKPGMTGRVFRFAIWYSHMVPPEAIEKYGDLMDWKNSCGTGAFMLTDYVEGSNANFVRNPDYWMKDPRHPENRLPYVDAVKYVIVPDFSTRLAAMRSGKAAILNTPLGWDDTESLKGSNPDLQWSRTLNSGASAVFMRVDKPELPWYDKRVRQALFMAIDNEGIAKSYYSGQAEVFAWPILPIPEHMDMFVPLAEFPPSVREQYEYHPEKAKKLLAEAGYPKGFKAEVVCVQGYVDILSIIKNYWAQIGVDLDIAVKELGAYTNMGFKRSHEQMYMSGVNPTVLFTFSRLERDQGYNFSCINDPLIEEAWKKVTANYFDEALKRQAMKDVVPQILEQAYILPMPANYLFTPWQPWVKGYNGEMMVGSLGSLGDFVKYIWTDRK